MFRRGFVQEFLPVKTDFQHFLFSYHAIVYFSYSFHLKHPLSAAQKIISFKLIRGFLKTPAAMLHSMKPMLRINPMISKQPFPK